MTRPLPALDRQIDEGPRASLAPNRRRATSLGELMDQVCAGQSTGFRSAYEKALGRIAAAQLSAFPENLFWDLDALAHGVGREALGSSTPERTLGTLAARVEDLQALFGKASVIRFRYVHDFVYGFDWNAWVRRGRGGPNEGDAPHGASRDLAPNTFSERRVTPPFDSRFLAYQLARGQELVALIAANDTKYPKLPDGTLRNPFAFSRDPHSERRLFEHLAAEDLLPVRAWERAPQARFDADYRARRRTQAAALL